MRGSGNWAKTPHHLFEDRRVRSLEALAARDVMDATAIVGALISQTPMTRIAIGASSNRSTCWVKLETETPTKSFKIRGAINFVSGLTNSSHYGIPTLMTASTGNHGIGLAWACRAHGKAVTVVTPMSIPPLKYERLKKLGANVVVRGETLDDAIMWARAEAARDGSYFVPSFNPAIVLGHSSVGVEIFQQQPRVDRLFFPMGVGSGIAGMALARDLLSPKTKLIGVVPETCDTWVQSFVAGHPVTVIPQPTTADGLKTACPDADIFRFLSVRLEKIISVSEEEIADARATLSDRLRLETEGAGVVGLAGLIKMSTSSPEEAHNWATVICG